MVSTAGPCSGDEEAVSNGASSNGQGVYIRNVREEKRRLMM